MWGGGEGGVRRAEDVSERGACSCARRGGPGGPDLHLFSRVFQSHMTAPTLPIAREALLSVGEGGGGGRGQSASQPCVPCRWWSV